MIYSKVLLVHGPNLTLYKNSNTDLPIITSLINPGLLQIKPDLEIVQTNDLTSLIDLLVSAPDYYDAMIINIDWAIGIADLLKQTIKLLELPTIEVNTRENKIPSPLKDITLLEICGELSLSTYKLALAYLLDQS